MHTLSIQLNDELLNRVDEVRWSIRAPSRRACLVDLIRRGLDSLTDRPAEGTEQ